MTGAMVLAVLMAFVLLMIGTVISRFGGDDDGYC